MMAERGCQFYLSLHYNIARNSHVYTEVSNLLSQIKA